MKLVKSLAIGALALACVGSSFATTVKVTGSTAFRKALYNAIISQGYTRAVYVTSKVTTIDGANQAIFKKPASNDYVIAALSGSVGGVHWIATSGDVAIVAPFDANYANWTTQAWLNPANATIAGDLALAASNATASTSGVPTGGTQLLSNVDPTADIIAANTTYFSAHGPANFTLSDSFQDSTPDAGLGLTLADNGTQGNDGKAIHSNSSLGVVQFVIAKGVDTYGVAANLTNINATSFRALSNLGSLNLDAITGVAADAGTTAVLVGRDTDSGTRLATIFETGISQDVTSNVGQYQVFDSTGLIDVGVKGGSNKVGQLAFWGFNAGYSGGSYVKNALNASLDSAGVSIDGGALSKKVILIGYVSTGDKPTAAAQVLTYNGTAQSAYATQNLPYTFWTYEFGYYNLANNVKDENGATIVNAGKPDATQVTEINKITAALADTYVTTAGGLTLNSMNVAREIEGGAVHF